MTITASVPDSSVTVTTHTSQEKTCTAAFEILPYVHITCLLNINQQLQVSIGL